MGLEAMKKLGVGGGAPLKDLVEGLGDRCF
jgi:hypothetical protein